MNPVRAMAAYKKSSLKTEPSSNGMKLPLSSHKLSSLLAAIVCLIFILLPFQALITTWPGSNFGHLDLFRIWKEILIFIISLPAFYLAWQSPQLKTWLKNSWLARLILIYAALTIGLGLWALSAGKVNRVALVYALIINLRFFYFFLVCAVVSSYVPRLRMQWQKIVLWPAAAVVLFGLAQRLFLPFDFLRHFGYGSRTITAYQTVDANLDYRRVQSTLRGANPLGAYLTLIIPSLLSLTKKYLKWFALFCTLAVLFFSYSRSAWVGTAIALGIISWRTLAKKIHWHYLATICATAVIAISVGLYFLGAQKSVQETLLHYSSTSSSSLSSNTQRSAALKNATKEIWHQPLGGGPGSAGPASFRNNHPARIAEDYYLQIGQEIGVLGIILFLAINGLVAKQLWSRRNEALSLVLLASLAGISFINLVSHAWADDTLSLLWWGLAGIALAPVTIKRRKDESA